MTTTKVVQPDSTPGGLPPPEWNDTYRQFPHRDLPELIDEQAGRWPNRPALTANNRHLTYTQLQKGANQLAHHLRSLGIGPGQLVASRTDRSFDMVVGLLGILKTGAAYVPLDPMYPKDRLAFMLQDADVAALITQARWDEVLPDLSMPRICLDKDRSVLDSCSAETFASPAGGEDLAYVIYTSGSTGKPKGVAVRRCALVNFLWAMKRNLRVDERDAVLALTTISFDIACLEIYLPLLVGARVVLAAREDALDGIRLARLIERENVTLVQATPATWRMLLDSPWRGNQDLQILCGGEAMTRDLADRLLTKGSCLWNMYGPTETTVWSTMARIQPGDEPISIGRPIDNTEIHILDEDLQPVRVGEVGELHIGGVGLARGYLNRPDLTAAKFIPHPWGQGQGERLYKTGDLGRYWPDGRIECLGRVDHQVKIRGFRIELPEIEARMSVHPHVKQAAVVALQDGNGDNYLSAYWVPESQAPEDRDANELRRFLADTLPPYMVPSVFIPMETLPLTPNGKIDRRALPAPDRSMIAPQANLVEPATTTERCLVEIWEQLLDVKPIGIRDDFFALGGHSLAAARMVARLETEMSISLPVSTLLSAPTIEALARIIDGHGERDRSSVVVPFRESGRRPPLFLVAGIGGHVLIFRELAGLLGEDQPVYGLQGIGLDGRECPLSKMEDIAARYAREIVSIQPEGPYHIAGWSMGGIIAYAIAQELLRQGRRLDALIIIDAYAPWSMSFTQRLRIHLTSFRQRSWPDRFRYVDQRLTHQAEVFARRLGFDRVDGLEGPTAERVRDSSLAQYHALRRYRPTPLAADIVLLRAEQTAEVRDPRADDPYLGWNSLIRGRIRIQPITGSHTGIFLGENVRTVAAAIKLALDTEAPGTRSLADLGKPGITR